MKNAFSLLVVLIALGACNRTTASDDDGGRYSGVGIYDADGVWKHVKGAPSTSGEQAALKDDTAIIVVVDRQSGEVRQCGNHSGFCIALNPWHSATPRLPVSLDAHADQLGDGSAAPANNSTAE